MAASWDPRYNCITNTAFALKYAPAHLHRPTRLFVSAVTAVVFGAPAVVVAVCCAIHIVVMISNPIRGPFQCSLARDGAIRAKGMPLEAALPIFVMTAGVSIVAGIQLVRIVNTFKGNRHESRKQ